MRMNAATLGTVVRCGAPGGGDGTCVDVWCSCKCSEATASKRRVAGRVGGVAGRVTGFGSVFGWGLILAWTPTEGRNVYRLPNGRRSVVRELG